MRGAVQPGCQRVSHASFAPGDEGFAAFFAGFVPRTLAAEVSSLGFALVKSTCSAFLATRPPTITDAATTSARAELLALVQRAQGGDMSAQSELVRRYTIRISA